MNKNLFLDMVEKDSIFVDRNVLLPSYLPEKLLFRDEEIKQMAETLKPLMFDSRPSNMFLYGKTGTGKTSSIKHLFKQIEEAKKEEIAAIYLNCSNYNSKYKVNCRILKEFDSEKDFVGFSASFVFEKLIDLVEKKGKQLLVCLDEIDKVKDLDDLVYGLTRANDELKKGSITVVGISNNAFFKDKLDPRTKSSLMEKEFVFKPYNANELKEILNDRASNGLRKESFSESALSLISALSAKQAGDARTALMLLLKSAELADKNGRMINEETIMKARKDAEKEIIMHLISALPEQQQLVLMAVALLAKDKKGVQKLDGNKERLIYSGEAFEEYIRLTKEYSAGKVSMRWFREYLNELELYGLITMNGSSKGFKGQTRFINLGFNSNEIIETLEKELN